MNIICAWVIQIVPHYKSDTHRGLPWCSCWNLWVITWLNRWHVGTRVRCDSQILLLAVMCEIVGDIPLVKPCDLSEPSTHTAQWASARQRKHRYQRAHTHIHTRTTHSSANTHKHTRNHKAADNCLMFNVYSNKHSQVSCWTLFCLYRFSIHGHRWHVTGFTIE